MNARSDRASAEYKAFAGVGAILIYFFLLSHRGLRTYFDGFDAINLVSFHGYWRWPWWWNFTKTLVVVTPAYRPMGDVFYRLFYGLFGFHALPFRVACYALLVLNLILFFRLALILVRCRWAALLCSLVFSFHAPLGGLYLSTGTVYDILCVCFTLAALIRYASVRSSGRELGGGDIGILLLLCGGALDSKEMAASLPLALILYEILVVRQGLSGRLLRRALPVILTGLLTVVALAAKIPTLLKDAAFHSQFSPSYVLSSYRYYLGLLVFRARPAELAWLIVAAVLAAAACLAARRRVALFGLCYGLASLLPVAGVAGRDGYVLYLPLVGFALFAGDLLAAVTEAIGRAVPIRASRSFWVQAGFFAIVAICLFVIQSRDWHDRVQAREREDAAVRETVRMLRAWHPTLPAGARLFLLDDPMPDGFPVQLLIQAAYHDPSLCAERQKNFATPIDAKDYAVFDYVVSIEGGKLEARRLAPIRWQGPAVPVEFKPLPVAPGQPIQMRVGTYASAAVDIEYRSTWRFSGYTGIALRWATLNGDGVATIPISGLQDPVAVEISAVRVSGDVWRKAHGGFVVP